MTETHTESRKGANPNLTKNDGCTPLWIAASRGSSQCIELLIKYGADLNQPDLSEGATPLYVACQNGRKASVELLLTANADVNQPRSGDGTTPLMIAANRGHVDVVDVLLKSGSDPMQANTFGLTALGCAASEGHVGVLKLTHQYLLNVKNAQEISDFGNAGANVNGLTALHLACMGGHERVIQYLINVVKVDIFTEDYEKKTGLDYALQNGHHAIVSWLSQLNHAVVHAVDCQNLIVVLKGDRVRLAGGKTGLIKFIGQTEFAKSEVIGLQLDTWTPAGHNGTVRNKKYFEAEDGYGYFTRRSSIAALLEIAKLDDDDTETNTCLISLQEMELLKEIEVLESKRANGVVLHPKQVAKINLKEAIHAQLEQLKKDSHSADEKTGIETESKEPMKSDVIHAVISDATDLKIDDTVELRSGKIGTIRFIGPVDFGEGDWIGVELHNSFGPRAHDGVIRGRRYFTCSPKRGIFVKEIKSVLNLNVVVDDRVRLKDQKTGIVRWKGQFDAQPDSKAMDYYGIELDEPYCCDNIGRYPTHNDLHFDCAPHRGIFVTIATILETLPSSPDPTADGVVNVQVGDIIRLGHGGTGVVKYIGMFQGVKN
eukprot:256049_1